MCASVWALKLLDHEKGTIYTDSKYAFGIVHTFEKIREERGLLNSRGKGLIHERLILEVLEALRLPEEIAVVHIKGHQKGKAIEIRGNNLANRQEKDAAKSRKERMMIVLISEDKESGIPKFSKPVEDRLREIGAEKNDAGIWRLPDGRRMLNRPCTKEVLDRIHQKTHWGTEPSVMSFYRIMGV